MPASHRPAHTSSLLEPAILGTLCAGCAAVGYTGANTALRYVSDCDPVWVSAMKTVPSLLMILPWLAWRMSQGQHLVSRPRPMLLLAGAGFLGQLGGNVAFQWSLGVIGLAMTVPLTLGSMILSGAVMQRWLLGETVTRRSIVSMGVLVLAIGVLSLGASAAHEAVAGTHVALAAGWDVAAGVAAACCCGAAYALMGVALRNAMQQGTPLPTALGTVAMCGMIALWSLSWWRIGVAGMLATNTTDFWVMILAGLFNAVSFLALTKALHLTSVVHVNALNASQAGMCATVGVLFYGEPFTWALAAGVGLTVVGLSMMKGRSRRRGAQPAVAVSLPLDYTLAELPARKELSSQEAADSIR